MERCLRSSKCLRREHVQHQPPSKCRCASAAIRERLGLEGSAKTTHTQVLAIAGRAIPVRLPRGQQ
eukprot:64532-Rhodomonas_salina.1